MKKQMQRESLTYHKPWTPAPEPKNPTPKAPNPKPSSLSPEAREGGEGVSDAADLIRTSICDKFSGLIKITTRRGW